MLSDNNRIVVTIGRQFGSGGRELGYLLAKTYGLKYYDKELLTEAARRSGMSREFFEKSDERMPSFLSGIFSFAPGLNPMSYYAGSTSISDDSIYRAQSDFINRLAEEESCVIVGRSADYVLRNDPRMVSVFVSASESDCVKRILSRDTRLTPQQAISKMRKINKIRANYYNFYTDKQWGSAASYDLCFDTSKISMPDIVALIGAYIRLRFVMELPEVI